MTAVHKERPEIIDAPYALRARKAEVARARLRLTLNDGVAVEIPIKALGAPWTKATAAEIARVRLRMGGSWLWWDDLGEGVVLDELLTTTLRLNPAALLARRSRGRRASPAKRAAARKNGRKGGRPRKVAK
jgi:hypothetical protein